ncbi:hypothetical protein [Streptomyces chrestomyceticus]|uniref:hypothetical protein n=1 Tax=Streptomyces chrestomyceticus TaxID=68185 RepID=UPI0035A8B6CD
MALRRFAADPFTRAELGRKGLEELSRNLWHGSCQTCGGAFGDEIPVVVIADGIVSITATLHHATCQRPRWCRLRASPSRGYLSTTVQLLPIPFGDPGRDPFFPTLLANPGLEEVTLASTDGRYRAVTVESFRPLGLHPPVGDIVQNSSDQVAAWLTPERLIVRCGDLFWVISRDKIHNALVEMVLECEGLVLGVSTAIDPAGLINPEPVKRVLRTGEIAAAFVPLSTATSAPKVTSHSIALCSDLTLADETDDVAWLPEHTPYPGPTYDSATGRFTVGMGMDGPSYWQLTVPGNGVENGLIVGPQGIGKTNMLRVLLIEAVCSGIFQCVVIDSLGRNALDAVFGRYVERMVTGPDQGRSLLSTVARAVAVRCAKKSDYRSPAPTTPGLLLAIDDAQAMFREPATAQIAADIALNGPEVGVALVAVMPSLDLEEYGGRRDLLLRLAKKNALVFSRKQVEQLAQIRAKE